MYDKYTARLAVFDFLLTSSISRRFTLRLSGFQEVTTTTNFLINY